jgi:DHA1 family inner membrane transport protein
LGFLAVIVAAPALIVAATAPKERSFTLGCWAGYVPVGSGAIIVFAAALLPASGWRGVWVVTAVVAALCAAFIGFQRMAYRATAEGARRSLASIRASLRQPVPWLLGLALAMFCIQLYAITVLLPTYLLETRNMSATQAALLTALYVFISFAGNVLGSRLLERNVPRGYLIGAAFLVASVLFIGIFSDEVADAVRYVLLLATSVASGTIAAATLSGGARYARSPAEVGSIQGLIVQLANVGIFIAAPITAMAVIVADEWRAALWVLLGAALAGIVAAGLIARHERIGPGDRPAHPRSFAARLRPPCICKHA